MPYKDPDEQRRFQRERVARIRAEWLDANGPCVDCGSSERLEVDHVDPATKITHNVWSWTEKRRLAELAKCVVRCHDCHLAKTSRERAATPIQHGTDGAYTKRKCHCPSCTEAHRVAKRRQRAARRARGLRAA